MRLIGNLTYGIFLASIWAASLYFTVSNIQFKQGLARNQSFRPPSGIQVKILRVIDGDEVSVQYQDKQFVVRMLGIKSFDPNVNDPVVAGYATLSKQFLEQNVGGKEAKLSYREFKQDKGKRVLAYLERADKDLGLEMVKAGLTLTYNRYSFSRLALYEEWETIAAGRRIGIWGNRAARKRSERLKKIWEKERKSP